MQTLHNTHVTYKTPLNVNFRLSPLLHDSAPVRDEGKGDESKMSFGFLKTWQNLENLEYELKN